MSERNGVSMPWYAWTAAAGVFVVLLGGTVAAASWVTGSVVQHQTAIELHGQDIARHERQLDRIDAKLDRILEALAND